MHIFHVLITSPAPDPSLCSVLESSQEADVPGLRGLADLSPPGGIVGHPAAHGLGRHPQRRVQHRLVQSTPLQVELQWRSKQYAASERNK